MRIVCVFAIFFVVCLTEDVYGRKLFQNGRPVNRHGFLGLPVRRLMKTNEDDEQIKEQWFEQRLDHFDPTNTKTWKQRFFVSQKYFNHTLKAPVFLQLGGEGEADPAWLKESQISNNFAPHYHALNILLEHRYYGKSWPTSDLSTDNLKYLTSEQALKDTAAFIEYIKEKYHLLHNKWIVFGGSYSGSLAAWFRLKYPHMVAGAVASSAPVQAILDFRDYIRVVEESLGPKCVEEVRSATEELSELLKSEKNWPLIEKKFHLCDHLDGNNRLDVSNLMSNLANNFEGVVQYNRDNRAFEGVPGTNITIDTLCSIMSDVDSFPSSTDRLAKVNKMLLDTYSTKCLEFKYEDYIKQMKEEDWNKTESGSRQWFYQTCTEFGFYQTSDLPNQPFGDYFPLDFFIRQCKDIYGQQFNEEFIQRAIEFTNNNYGGFNLTLTNVIFPNGQIDPWHALGVLHPINPTAKPLLMKTTAHCADMYPDSDIDPPELKKARDIIKHTIGEFLAH